MRAITVCAVDMELPENNGRYLIGAADPEWVDSDRMHAIPESVGPSPTVVASFNPAPRSAHDPTISRKYLPV